MSGCDALDFVMLAASPFRRVLTLGFLGASAALLWATRPHFDLVAPSDQQSASCLSNLSQISRALSLYARDFDDRIPLAVDPADRSNPGIWTNFDDSGTDHAHFARSAPYLHEVLRPYLDSATRFRCPSDTGWSASRLQIGAGAGLFNVRPSSFAKYGTSYYWWTQYSFDLRTVADIPDPSRRAVLFDGDLWHRVGTRELGSELFFDGHAALLNKTQHGAAAP